MAVVSASVSVATTATRLDSGDGDLVSGSTVLVTVPAGGATVYVGGADVTTANGFPLPAGASVSVDLNSGDLLYGIVAASTQAVNVLRVGV
jgi:hypothetical protein